MVLNDFSRSVSNGFGCDSILGMHLDHLCLSGITVKVLSSEQERKEIENELLDKERGKEDSEGRGRDMGEEGRKKKKREEEGKERCTNLLCTHFTCLIPAGDLLT